ncbi:MAG TPA: RNA-binding protein [Anaerolineaceae bacterium]|jgi:RNA recognition motif-containing protein|nr:RNA-binding protein [Anaerolineaceae bacterium]
MGTKLYVGNLSYDTTEDGLRAAFTPFGTVVEVAMIKDRDTGSPKGFAFVTMSTDQEARNAIQSLNDKMLDGRAIKVNEARPREESGPRRNTYGNRR